MFEMCILLKKKKKKCKAITGTQGINYIQTYSDLPTICYQIKCHFAIGTENNLNFISYIASEGLKFSTGIVYEPLLWSF